MRSALLALAALLMAKAVAASAGDALAIVGGTAILPGARPLADSAIVIENGRIVAVGPQDALRLPPSTPRIDARGTWIIPGLIDAHVHFFQSGGLYTRPDVIDLRAVRPYEQEIARIRERLPATFARYIASGVTAVADTGGPRWNFQVRELAKRLDIAPHVAVAGPADFDLPAARTRDRQSAHHQGHQPRSRPGACARATAPTPRLRQNLVHPPARRRSGRTDRGRCGRNRRGACGGPARRGSRHPTRHRARGGERGRGYPRA